MNNHNKHRPSHANLMCPASSWLHFHQQQLLLPGDAADEAQRRATAVQRGHQAAIRGGTADGLLHLDFRGGNHQERRCVWGELLRTGQYIHRTWWIFWRIIYKDFEPLFGKSMLCRKVFYKLGHNILCSFMPWYIPIKSMDGWIISRKPRY